MVDSDRIRVVVLKEGDLWVAQCLEIDVGAQAPDFDTLWSRLNAVVRAERNESVARFGKPFEGIPAAPAIYHTMWEKAPRHHTSDPTHGPDDNDDDGPTGFRFAMCA